MRVNAHGACGATSMMKDNLEKEVQKAIDLMSRTALAGGDVDVAVTAEFPDDVMASRLLNFIREAFGTVFILHLDGKAPILPQNFQVMALAGQWKQVPFSHEPVFAIAVRQAQEMYHSASRANFMAIAMLSATYAIVEQAAEKGVSIAGATFGAPCIGGVPAEIYPPMKRNLAEKFFDWLLAKRKSRSA